MYDTERIREEDPKYLMLYPERERPMNKLLEAISRAGRLSEGENFPRIPKQNHRSPKSVNFASESVLPRGRSPPKL